ncbi:MAG: CBS domain-containing protein [Candidatus Bathyarchaeia archaeon]
MSHPFILTSEDFRRARKAMGLTQRELSKMAGVSQSLIARIENGTVDPRLSTARKIIQALFPKLNKMSASQVMHSPVITVNAQDTVRRAVDIMREKGYSQLPVLMDGRIVGSVRETTLLDRVAKSGNPTAILNGSVYNVMEKSLPTVHEDTSLDEIIDKLSSGEPAILVTRDGSISGIITKIDVISMHLNPRLGLQ